MLEKLMYDSWASRICLFIKGKKHGRIMLDLIDNGPLVYPTVEENRQTRHKKYSELTEAQQLQDDCDVQATNIIIHGLPPDVLYNLFDKFAYVQGETLLVVPMFQQGEDLIEYINKAMAFLSAVASRFPPSNNQLRTSSNPRNQATIQDAGQPRIMKCYNCQGEGHMARQYPGISEAPVAQQTIPQNLAFQTNDLDVFDSNFDDLSLAKAVLIANLSSCDPEVLYEVPYSNSYPNDMSNQDAQEMQYSEQTHVDDFQDNKIHRGSNYRC
ncbi:integrase, catalytic region, zinc finger, CCHC-type containing protein [Tanacetum coccineum]